MGKRFDHKNIEKKWQKSWKESGIYVTGDRDDAKEKKYILVEFPYPSGNLHIGHWFAFAVLDIYVRALRMQGKQVFFPIGFDSFGLPAENAAIKRNLNPKDWTYENIAKMTEQLESMGNAFSWEAMLRTSDPEYYKWTQWMFTQFFEKDIAYRGLGAVNWCPSCHTVLANEQVADGKCERCGSVVEQKIMNQWMMRITKYADRLIDGLEPLDWPESIKDSQRNWIGRSSGAEIDFKLSTGDIATVFTTRADTLYGATYLVLAPDHDIVSKLKASIANWTEVEAYQKVTKGMKDIERMSASKVKTGVRLEGVTAVNPTNDDPIPVFIADYVLATYGTGAIMAVPAHDERDYAFATAFGLKTINVVAPYKVTHSGALLELMNKPGTFLFQRRDMNTKILPGMITTFGGHIEADETTSKALERELAEELELKFDPDQVIHTYTQEGLPGTYVHIAHIIGIERENLILHEGEAILEMTIEEAIAHPDLSDMLRTALKAIVDQTAYYCEEGIVHSSDEFSHMTSEEAKEKIVAKVGGRNTNKYKLRDWSVGRQRYWGVPIPIVYDPEGKPHPVPMEHLPWLLPEDVDFNPTGEPPLAKSKELKERTERIFGIGWTPEVETLDTFVDSSWHFLRFADNHNESEFASETALNKWLPVDVYFGGAEHTTMHLLYSRFWQKVLFDLKFTNFDEPYTARINRGLVLGPDGNKMSKSKGNVIDPDEQVERLGADTVKMYLAFMGPYAQPSNYPWDLGGIAGIRRFLERAYELSDSEFVEQTPEGTKQLLHQTIKKVSTDIAAYKFNTALSALMIFLNSVEKTSISKNDYEIFLRLIAPFAPHLTEELWANLGKTNSVHMESWPQSDSSLAQKNSFTIGVQINGKVRGTIMLERDASESDALKAIEGEEQILKYIKGAPPKKVIYVKNKILNLIID